MRTIALALSLLLLHATPAAPAPPTRYVWTICLDTTMSVPSKEFAEYPAIAAAWVLPRLRPGDTVVVLRLDQPDGGPQTFMVDTRPSRLAESVRALDAGVREVKQVRDPRAGTDLGLALDFVRKQIDTDGKLGGTPATAYRLVVLTDGILDGKQSLRAWPAITVDARGVFIGTHPNTEEGLRKLARQAGFANATDVQAIEFGARAVAASAIDRFFGRSADPSLLRKLAGPRTIATKRGS